MSGKKMIKTGKWRREFDFDFDTRVFFSITTDKFLIQLTGGSVIIINKVTGEIIKRLKGFNYLYTGDVNPDETQLVALENGKHFFVISLEDYTQKMRVTLPRNYEAIDVYGEFSDNGDILFIPVQRYIDDKYEYQLCEYDTKTYKLMTMNHINSKVNRW